MTRLFAFIIVTQKLVLQLQDFRFNSIEVFTINYLNRAFIYHVIFTLLTNNNIFKS